MEEYLKQAFIYLFMAMITVNFVVFYIQLKSIKKELRYIHEKLDKRQEHHDNIVFMLKNDKKALVAKK
jgi:hypothetical protein